MTTQLKDFIRRCDTCRTMDPQQQKEPLVCYEVVKQVWGKIGVDLFQHKGRDYLITIDYLTNFWEVDHLNRLQSFIVQAKAKDKDHARTPGKK